MENFELKEFSLEEQSLNNFKIIVIDPQEEYKNLVERMKECPVKVKIL